MLVQKGILSNEAMPQEIKEGAKYLFVGAPKRIRTSDLRIRRPRRDTIYNRPQLLGSPLSR